jgi:DNA-binding transcriptional MerR regulator
MKISKKAFASYLRQRGIDPDPDYYQLWNELALGALDQFFKPGGMAIGAFSALVGLPVSTVRHYLKLGLVEPYQVEGAYRFHPFNAWEVKSVQHWQDLGLSLEQAVARRHSIRSQRPGTMVLDVLGPLQIQGKPYAEGVVYLRRLPEGGGYREIVIFGVADGDTPMSEDTEELFSSLLLELEDARKQLQAKLDQLTEKLNRLQRKRLAIQGVGPGA